jgi:hypothetical protein
MVFIDREALLIEIKLINFYSMQRDKRGRFVKKAEWGLKTEKPSFSLNTPNLLDPYGTAQQTQALDAHNMFGLGETFAP